MPIVKLFSERMKEARGELTDVYQYSEIPDEFRVQMVHITNDALGNYSKFSLEEKPKAAYKFICETLRREYGVFFLFYHLDKDNYYEDLCGFLLHAKDAERFMDAVELICQLIEGFASQEGYFYQSYAKRKEVTAQAISEINSRLKRHGIGYQYLSGEIIRVDSELIHSETVKPALTLLGTSGYEGPQKEFLSAYEHYRHGRAKEALVDALKAFESVMKVICEKRGWIFDRDKATAKDLISLCYEKGLIPNYWQGHFGGIRATLESGVPTVRNREGGHGGGSTPKEVPDYLVAYALHMTASTIVFLANAEKELA